MVTQATHLARSTGTSYTLTRATGTNYALVQSSDTYANYLDALLAESVWWIDAHQATASETIPNLGTGGTALDALNGGGTAITTNDAKWLAYSAADGAYVYLPNVASNYLSVPDEAALDITGDIDIRVKVALDDWTQTGDAGLLAKMDAAGQRSYMLYITAAGTIIFYYTTDGTTLVNRNSSTTAGITDGTVKWVRATLDANDGAGNHVVKFYLSDDGSVWTQLGTTLTTAGTVSMFSGTSSVRTAFGTGTTPAGKVYRAIIYSDLTETTKVLDINTSVLTSGSATSFVATTGQTVSISRGTAGRKSTVVHGGAGGGSLWLLGTDDYMEVADNALLDFGASDSFTVLAVVRQWATPTSQGRYIDKANNTDTGWMMATSGTTPYRFRLDDGPNAATAVATITNGEIAVMAATINRGTQLATAYSAGVAGTPVDTSAVGDLSNAYVMRVGRAGEGGAAAFQDFEFTAALIWRRALTTAEISAVSTYMTTRTHAE